MIVAPPAAPDFELIHKIPPEHRYFNISTKFIPYYPAVIKGFYRLGLRHEVATGLSIASGVAGAAALSRLPGSKRFLAAALAVHLKDVFDATDGALARVTGTGHRLGRFVDTVGDGMVLTLWIGAAAGVMVRTGTPALRASLWAVAAWFSLFLQCSYFNYHQLHYLRWTGAESASRLDEREEPADPSTPVGKATAAMAQIYDRWFGWQDRAVAAWDRRERIASGLPAEPEDPGNDRWFSDRRFMVANSALCFGTHAFVLIGTLVARRPQWFPPAVAVGMNGYFAAIAIARRRVFARSGS